MWNFYCRNNEWSKYELFNSVWTNNGQAVAEIRTCEMSKFQWDRIANSKHNRKISFCYEGFRMLLDCFQLRFMWLNDERIRWFINQLFSWHTLQYLWTIIGAKSEFLTRRYNFGLSIRFIFKHFSIYFCHKERSTRLLCKRVRCAHMTISVLVPRHVQAM